MTFFADRVKDTTTTTGTGTLTLANAPSTGFRSFDSGFVVNSPVYYTIVGGAEFETGMGRRTAANTLTRDRVFTSSNANALVTLSAGTKDVFCDAPSKYFEGLYEARNSPAYFTDFPAPVLGLLGPFSVSAIASGTFNVAAAAGVVTGDHPGVVLLRSSTTTNSGAVVNTLATSLLIAGGEEFDAVFRTPGALTSNTLRFGFHDSATSADAVDGIYFEVAATGVATGKTSSNSVRTTSATIATLVINTWYHARIVVNPNATGVDFFIFSDAGSQLGTVNITTNIPTASGRECGVTFVGTNVGTTAVDIVNLDYMGYAQSRRTLTRGALN